MNNTKKKVVYFYTFLHLNENFLQLGNKLLEDNNL